MPNLKTFESQFEDIKVFITQATENVQSGNLCDMNPLRDDIEALCKAVESSAPDIAHQMKPVMADVIAQLDHLADAIKIYRDAI